MTYAEETKAVVGIVKKVLPLLLGSWKLDKKWLKESGHGVRIVNESSDLLESFKAISFSLMWNKKERLIINGSYEYELARFLPYTNREKVEITVSANKTPARIAMAIDNRLMPPYERMLRYCLEGKQSHDEYHDNQKRALERVAKAYGKGAEVNLNNDGTANSVHAYEPFSFTGVYSTLSGETIKMDIDLPLDKAIEVLHFIRGKKARKKLS